MTLFEGDIAGIDPDLLLASINVSKKIMEELPTRKFEKKLSLEKIARYLRASFASSIVSRKLFLIYVISVILNSGERTVDV
jgi:hypothetical protein